MFFKQLCPWLQHWTFYVGIPPRPLSMLEMQTKSMEDSFSNNIELREKGEFFPTLKFMVVV